MIIWDIIDLVTEKRGILGENDIQPNSGLLAPLESTTLVCEVIICKRITDFPVMVSCEVVDEEPGILS